MGKIAARRKAFGIHIEPLDPCISEGHVINGGELCTVNSEVGNTLGHQRPRIVCHQQGTAVLTVLYDACDTPQNDGEVQQYVPTLCQALIVELPAYFVVFGL